MAEQQQNIEFASGPGWGVEQLTFMPGQGIRVEARFAGEHGELIFLELHGVRSPELLPGLLTGFDDFQIVTRDTAGACAAWGRFLFRYFINDDVFEIIVDDYEAHRTTRTA